MATNSIERFIERSSGAPERKDIKGDALRNIERALCTCGADAINPLFHADNCWFYLAGEKGKNPDVEIITANTKLKIQIDWQEDAIAERERMIGGMAEIIYKLCIELKKDNAIGARRKQAKIQYDEMVELIKGVKQ